MTEQRLKVESGPPEHVVSDAEDRAGHDEQSAADGAKDTAQAAASSAR